MNAWRPILADAESIINGLKKRKENDIALKELEKSIEQIRKALGKDVIYAHTAEPTQTT